MNTTTQLRVPTTDAPTVIQDAGTVHRVALARDYYQKLFGYVPKVYIRGGNWTSENGEQGRPDDWLLVEPRTWGFYTWSGVAIRRKGQAPFQFKLEV